MIGDQASAQRGPTVVACRVCGAPMRERAASGADLPVLACVYCGASEPLPLDAQERVFALRALGAARRWPDDPLRGALVSLLARYEGSVLATSLGSLALVGLCVAASLLLATGKPMEILHQQSIPGLTEAELRDLQWSTAFWAVLAPVMLTSMALYVVAAVLRARWVLRREIAPLVLAEPAPIAGDPERCRRCGGELPQAHTALRDCTFCGAANVVSASGVVRAFVAAARAAPQLRPHEAAAKLAQVEEQLRRDTGRAAVGALIGGALLALALTYALVHLAR